MEARAHGSANDRPPARNVGNLGPGSAGSHRPLRSKGRWARSAAGRYRKRRDNLGSFALGRLTSRGCLSIARFRGSGKWHNVRGCPQENRGQPSTGDPLAFVNEYTLGRTVCRSKGVCPVNELGYTRCLLKGDTRKNEGQEDQEHTSDLPTLYVYPLIPNDDADLERRGKNKKTATSATVPASLRGDEHPARVERGGGGETSVTPAGREIRTPDTHTRTVGGGGPGAPD